MGIGKAIPPKEKSEMGSTVSRDELLSDYRSNNEEQKEMENKKPNVADYLKESKESKMLKHYQTVANEKAEELNKIRKHCAEQNELLDDLKKSSENLRKIIKDLETKNNAFNGKLDRIAEHIRQRSYTFTALRATDSTGCCVVKTEDGLYASNHSFIDAVLQVLEMDIRNAEAKAQFLGSIERE